MLLPRTMMQRWRGGAILGAAYRCGVVMTVPAALVLLLTIYALIFLPYLPNSRHAIGGDYSLWLPDLLTGYFWHLGNGWFSLPWFSPSQCGGVPFYADPQVAYLSVPQFLTFVMPPVEAVRTSVLLFAGLGFLGTWYLARITFRASMGAALLAGALFMFNSFYGARMLVGHLTYQPFMLTPALAATCLHTLPRACTPRGWCGATGVGGLLIAIMIQGGAVHAVPPALLSVAMLLAIYALLFRAGAAGVTLLAASIVLGCGLCAGKLAASIALLTNFPRDQYPLPGIPGLWSTAWQAFRALFLGPPGHPEAASVHSAWVLDRHEWEYSVSAVPLVLLTAWGGRALWTRRRPAQPALIALLGLLLAVPIALNWYEPAWNAFLKSLPFLGNSSNLLRWFAAYILPASIGAALALDAVAPERLRPSMAAASIACVAATTCLTDRSFYGPDGQGVYQVETITASWQNARRANAAPRVTAIRVLTDGRGRVIMPPNRQDALSFGYSQLFCYEPLFGYKLERFPIGNLHPGPALAVNAGLLNVKNPSCYVFPKTNACAPGDPFPASRLADAQAFLNYAPFPFRKPLWDRVADWLGPLTACMMVMMNLPRVRRLVLQTPELLTMLQRAPRPITAWRSRAHLWTRSVYRSFLELVRLRSDVRPAGQQGRKADQALGRLVHETRLVDLAGGDQAALRGAFLRLCDQLADVNRRLDVITDWRRRGTDLATAEADNEYPVESQSAAWPPGIIEVTLRNGVVIRTDSHVDTSALQRVLVALGQR